jgi:hypothetical protein
MVRIILILVGVLVVAVGTWAWIVFSHRSDLAQSPSTADESAAAHGRGGGTSDGRASGFSTFDPAKEFEDGEVVVANPPENFAADIGALGFSILESVDLSRLSMRVYRVRIPANSSVDQARRTIAARFPGAIVDSNHRFDPSQSRRQRSAGEEGAAAAIRNRDEAGITSFARAAIGWSAVPDTCGKGVRLGMIDSGVDLTHPALRGQQIEFQSFHNPQRRPGPANHGTAVAAILVGKPSSSGLGGLLPGAKLFAANMFEFDDIGKKVGNVMGLLKGLDWMIQSRVHAVNMSIAGSDNDVVRKAMDQARQRDLVMIAAAGNWGREDRPAYPAAYDDVVAVTAVGSYRDIYQRANRGEYIDFAAPGVRLLTAAPGGGTAYQSGTSFATPFLTVLMALEVAGGSGRDPDRLKKIFTAVTADLGVPGKDKVFGYGFVEKLPNCRS